MDEPLEKYQHKLELKDIKKEFPKVYQKVCCPSCDGEVTTANINIKDKIAMCDDCNVVFPFPDDLLNIVTSDNTTSQEILRPEGIEIFHFKNEMDITVKQPYTGVEIIPMMLIPFFAVFSTLAYFAKGTIPLSPVIIGWGLLVLLAYYFTQRQKHKIHITVDDNGLSIEWRPKKLKKDKHFAISDIEQLYTKKITDSDDGMGAQVYMIVDSGNGHKHEKLVFGLDSNSKAKYLEQEIERKLGIVNRKVPEES